MTGLAKEVDDMMKQLQEAEKELKRKQDDADQDMMMAGMVSNADTGGKEVTFPCLWKLSSLCSAVVTTLGPLSVLHLPSFNCKSEHRLTHSLHRFPAGLGELVFLTQSF